MSNSVVKELRLRYRASSAEKMALLLGLSEAYEGSQRAQGQRQEELYSALHKLVGSSGMYGYTDLHQVASQALKVIEGKPTDAAVVINAVAEVIQALDKL